MKEKYTSPELELLCFAPMQNLASNSEIDFSDLTTSNGLQSGASSNLNDVVVPMPSVPTN